MDCDDDAVADDAEAIWDGLDGWSVAGTAVADDGEDLLNPTGARLHVSFATFITTPFGVGLAEAVDS